MTEHVQISELVGQWEGTNYLWLAPDEPVRVSPTRASLELAAGGAFAELRYTWVEGGKTQEGLLLMRVSPQEGQAGMVWVDSWHMGDQFLFCQSLSGGEGQVNALGYYPAPEGPDWGWRIAVEAESAQAFVLRMFNITPEGEEALAVEARYTRLGAD